MPEAHRKGQRPIVGRVIGRQGNTFLLESDRNGGLYHITDPLYTYKEVAAELGLHASTIRRFVSNGLISCRRLGTRVRFTRADIDEYIEGSKVAAAPMEMEAKAAVAVVTSFAGDPLRPLVEKGKQCRVRGVPGR